MAALGQVLLVPNVLQAAAKATGVQVTGQKVTAQKRLPLFLGC